MPTKDETIGAGVETFENFSRSRQFNYQNIFCDLTKAPISLDCDCFATAGDRHREWVAKQSRNGRQ